MADKPTSRTIHGPTPAGGVRSTMFFRGPDGEPVPEDQAVAAEVVEYDSEGRHIRRTYMEKDDATKGTKT